MNKFRRCVRLKNGKKEDCKFEQLKKGEFFRMFEPNGDIVKAQKGERLFEALSDPKRLGNEGNWEIEIQKHFYLGKT